MKFIYGNNDKHEAVVVNPKHIIVMRPNYNNNCLSTLIFTAKGWLELDRTFESILSELTKEE